MAAPSSFPLVRGRVMRVSALDGCGNPVYGPDGQVVTDGFVSVALTANTNEAEEIAVVNAGGKTCVRDTGCPEFTGYSLDITFCEVDPCLYAIMTGQDVVMDAAGAVAGFKMNSKVSACDQGFALEVWSGVPGVACEGVSGAQGYILVPFIRSGVIGDFTIENAAVTFTVTGAQSQDGNGWGVGPYNVVEAADGVTPAPLPDPLDPDDHLYVAFTTIAPPVETNGCAPLPTPPWGPTGP